MGIWTIIKENDREYKQATLGIIPKDMYIKQINKSYGCECAYVLEKEFETPFSGILFHGIP